MSEASGDWIAWIEKAEHDLCGALAGELAEFGPDAEFLSPLAVFARYPGDPDEPSREDAARGIDIARRIRDRVRQHLPESEE